MKKGFTLMELLFVIVIVSVISISSVVVFGNIDDSTAAKDRINTYVDIQRGAVLYIDLNDYWLAQFKENKEIKIELSELKISNYIDIDIQDFIFYDCNPHMPILIPPLFHLLTI